MPLLASPRIILFFGQLVGCARAFGVVVFFGFGCSRRPRPVFRPRQASSAKAGCRFRGGARLSWLRFKRRVAGKHHDTGSVGALDAPAEEQMALSEASNNTLPQTPLPDAFQRPNA